MFIIICSFTLFFLSIVLSPKIPESVCMCRDFFIGVYVSEKREEGGGDGAIIGIFPLFFLPASFSWFPFLMVHYYVIPFFGP